MKHLYTTLFVAACLTGTADAQKPGQPVRSNHLASPAFVPHSSHVAAGSRGSAPANDDCSAVSTQELAVGGSLTLTGTVDGATETNDYVAGSGLEGFGPVVWHKFSIAGCADITVAYCGTAAVYQNVAAFLARTCPATDADYVLFSGGDFTSCSDGNATVQWIGVPAGTYYLPVLFDEANSAVGPYTIDLSATACPMPPPNDDCSGAITLPSSAVCTPVPATTTGATEQVAAITCNGFTSGVANEVWYKFVATATTQTIAVAAVEDFDAVIELFSGDCSALVSMGCEDSTYPSTETPPPVHEQMIRTDLTVGTTYYVRVYDWGHASAQHQFSICVVEGSGTNVGVSEVENDADWSIYPNPGTGVFNFQYGGMAAKGTIEVFDLTGRTVHSEQAQLVTGGVRSLDLSGVAQGNYTVRLTANGTRTEQRLLVK